MLLGGSANSRHIWPVMMIPVAVVMWSCVAMVILVATVMYVAMVFSVAMQQANLLSQGSCCQEERGQEVGGSGLKGR